MPGSDPVHAFLFVERRPPTNFVCIKGTPIQIELALCPCSVLSSDSFVPKAGTGLYKCRDLAPPSSPAQTIIDTTTTTTTTTTLSTRYIQPTQFFQGRS